MAQFENLIFKALETEKKSGNTKTVKALLKMLVEIRESAAKNEDYEEYESINKRLSEMGIELVEQRRITARVTTD